MKRAWIIGNGPSLNEMPLDLLRGEVSFAMNGIWRIYDRTRWRPTHYWQVDFNPRVPREEWEKGIRIHEAMGIPMALWDRMQTGYPEDHPNHKDMPEGLDKAENIPDVTWIPRCKHHVYHAGNSKGAQEWHLPEICTGYNGISGVIQWAVSLGYGPLYLLGCDLGYKADPRLNHFDPEYNNTDDRDLSEQLQADAEAAHELAARCSPVKIFNCTKGGDLTVYKRQNMRRILEKKIGKW